MKKRKLFTALLCAACLTAAGVAPVSADSSKVVTLGADLTDAQRQTMLNYFNVSSSEVRIIYVTNAEEYEELGGYISSEQIGTRTLSCAYVKPTSSGGIKVRTANLNYVNGNMIASALSTAGVKNCEVVAACPLEVSGTGALTGVMKAYEQASGVALSSSKKQLATKEMVVTGIYRERIGPRPATLVVNESKTMIIQNNITNVEEITNIVINVLNNNGITVGEEITQDDLDSLISLLQEIAEEGYDYEDVKDTLENVEDTLTEADVEEGASEGTDEETDEEADGEEEDSILDDVNVAAIGEDVIESSTEDADLEEETTELAEEDMEETSDMGDEEDMEETSEMGDDVFEVVVVDEDEESYETSEPESTEETGEAAGEAAADEGEWDYVWTEEDADAADTISEEDTWEYTEDYTESADEYSESLDGTETGLDETTEDTLDTSGAGLDTTLLSEQAQSQFSKAQLFCAGEYGGDTASLQSAMDDYSAYATVVLDSATASALTDAVESAYYNILYMGTGSFIADGTEVYMSTELNMMQDQLQSIFGLDASGIADSSVSALSLEDRQTLYNDTMNFFEHLYGETSAADTTVGETYDESAYYEENAYDESAYYEGETYDENTYDESTYEQDGYYDETTGEWVYY
ncbi:MAG: DUF1002 domain-containing protein [Clostridiales bacterium]|nr:DUF1002 domain-containing protein [Clostridiales bacterium]